MKYTVSVSLFLVISMVIIGVVFNSTGRSLDRRRLSR